MTHIEHLGGENLTAEEFISILRKSNEYWWQGSGAGDCVFRGIGNADKWNLTPSSWRPKEANKLTPLIEKFQELEDKQGKPRPLSEIWCIAEHHAVMTFSQLARDLGYDVGDFKNYPSGDVTAEYLHSVQDFLMMNYDHYLEHAPLAQHHGVPTRLLDWTHNPLVASYVALSDEWGDKNADRIRVWAINRTRVKSTFSNSQKRPPGSLRFVEQAPVKNVYLRAQQGLFTELSPDFDFFERCKLWPSLEDYFTKDFMDTPQEPYLVGVSLEKSQFERAKRILDREGVNHALLAPSLDNIAKTVIGRWDLET